MRKKLSSRAGWQAWQQAIAEVQYNGGSVSSYGALRVTSEYEGRGQLPFDWDDFLWKAVKQNMVEVIVYSYETPIAFLVDGLWLMPAHKYSRTTSKHQSLIQRATDSRCGALSDDDDEFYDLLSRVTCSL